MVRPIVAPVAEQAIQLAFGSTGVIECGECCRVEVGAQQHMQQGGADVSLNIGDQEWNTVDYWVLPLASHCRTLDHAFDNMAILLPENASDS
jgi:hypothetical protein